MNIETVKPTPNIFPTNRLFLFYGAPKIGKTTFAVTWKNALIFDLENGANDVECTRVQPSTYKELKENLESPELADFDTIIIDSLDIVYNWAEREAIARLNKQMKTNYMHVGQFPMGGGWAAAKGSLKSWVFTYIIPLLQQDKNVILIAHEKSETVKRQGKDDETRYGISLPGSTATLVTSLCDAIGRVHIKGGKHMVSFSPSQDLGGSRIKALAGRDIPLNIKILENVISKYTPKKVAGIKNIVDSLNEEDTE